MDIDVIYDGIVDGTRDPGDMSWTRRKLQLMALERAKSGPSDARLGALRVAAVLGTKDGLPIAQQLVRDQDQRVRTWAFNQAVAARELGLGAIRDAAQGTDPELAVAALDLLVRWVDQASVTAARRCLQSSDARVRALAARLLGNVGGTAVRLDLNRLERDPDAAVRDAAAQGMHRLAGELPKESRTPWWDEAPAAMPTPPPVGAAPPPVTPTHRSDAPAPISPAAIAPTSSPTPTSAPDPLTALVPAPEGVPAPEVVPAPVAVAEFLSSGRPPAVLESAPVPVQVRSPEDGPWDGKPAALPATMPTELRALSRLLGMVGPADQAAVLDVIRARDLKELGELLLSQTPGADPALGRGLCLAAGRLARNGALPKVRQLLGDPHPAVRAAAAEAVGAVGGASAIPALTGQLGEANPAVLAAVITALTALALRIGRPDLARDPLGRLRGNLPDVAAAALGDARQRLG